MGVEEGVGEGRGEGEGRGKRGGEGRNEEGRKKERGRMTFIPPECRYGNDTEHITLTSTEKDIYHHEPLIEMLVPVGKYL